MSEEEELANYSSYTHPFDEEREIQSNYLIPNQGTALGEFATDDVVQNFVPVEPQPIKQRSRKSSKLAVCAGVAGVLVLVVALLGFLAFDSLFVAQANEVNDEQARDLIRLENAIVQQVRFNEETESKINALYNTQNTIIEMQRQALRNAQEKTPEQDSPLDK